MRQKASSSHHSRSTPCGPPATLVEAVKPPYHAAMADLSTAARNMSVERQTDTHRLVRERLLWAVKPFGLLGIILWALHPTTTLITPQNPDLKAESILAFLFGAIYALVVHWDMVRSFFAFSMDTTINRRNRIPDEFYIGHIEEVRAQWSKP